MRVTSLIGLILVLGAIGFIGYCAWTQPEWLEDAWRSARGYTPAKTPQEVVDKFKDAIKSRDYKTAAEYCTADFREQLRKCARPAAALGHAVDSLEHNMEQEGIKSDEVRAILHLIEPFPADITLENLRGSSGDAKAAVVLRENFQPSPNVQVLLAGDSLTVGNGYWKVDGAMFRTLSRWVLTGPNRSVTVTLVREGEGDKTKWKFDFPVPDGLRKSVDTLKSGASNYVRTIDKVKYAIKKDAATKSDLIRELRTELEEAK